jgi:hypothetical protein
LVIGLLGFQVDPEIIQWKDSTKLKWSDFKGVPDNTRIGRAASTSCYIEYNFIEKEDVAEIEVYTIFDPNGSWKRFHIDESHINLLKHEQTHFDIFEIYARKFRKTISNTKLYSSGIKKDLSIILDRISTECEARQDLYDQQTEHSVNRQKQLEWEKMVNEELAALQHYSEPKLTLRLVKN